jgi:hypothetical protein
MLAGETLAKLRLVGEPRGLLVTIRANLSAISPERISLSIKKKRPAWTSPDFEFGWLVPHDRKLVEHRLSSQVLQMTSDEILLARHSISVLGDWLDGKSAAPRIDIPTERAHVQIEAIGKASETLAGLTAMTSLEPLSAIHLGPVYLGGQPRGPAVRWLPPVDSIDTSKCSEELALIRNSIGPEYFAELTEQHRVLRALFARKIDARIKTLRKLATEVLGDRAESWLREEVPYFGARIDAAESLSKYERVLTELKEIRFPTKKTSRGIRAWRA